MIGCNQLKHATSKACHIYFYYFEMDMNKKLTMVDLT